MAVVILDALAPQRVAAVLDDWRRDGPFHLLALLPEPEKGHVADLQRLCREAGVALSGALFPQLIHDGALWDSGAVLLRVAGAPPPLLLENVGTPEAVERVRGEVVAYVERHLAEAEDAALF